MLLKHGTGGDAEMLGKMERMDMSQRPPRVNDTELRTNLPQEPRAAPSVPDAPDAAAGRTGAGYPTAPPYYGQHPALYGAAAYSERERTGNLTPVNIARALLRKWMTIVLTTGFLFAMGYIYLMHATEVFHASAVIEMTLRKPRILGQTGAIFDDGFESSMEAFNTRLEKFKSTEMLQKVLLEYRQIAPDDQNPDAALISLFRYHIRTTLRRGTRLVDIVLDQPDPQFTADAVNAFVQGAIIHVSEENQATSDASVSWLQSQAKAQRVLLAEQERKLADFRANNSTRLLLGEKDSIVLSINALNSSLASRESETVLTKNTLTFLNGFIADSQTVETLPSDFPTADEIRETVKSYHLSMKVQQDMATRYTLKHPTMIAQNAEMQQLRIEIRRRVSVAQKSLSNKLKLHQQQAAGIRGQIDIHQNYLTEIERKVAEYESQIAVMERERDASDSSHSGILKRIEEARLSADENTALVRVIETANTPSKPISPNRLQTLFASIMLGLLCGCGLALLTDHLEDRVRPYEDVEREHGTRVLAYVPHVKSRNRNEIALASGADRFSQITEAFAGVRNALDAPSLRDLSKSVTVTSPEPEVGKTITSCNLAISMARRGFKTLIIDFDLRRPRLQSVFSIEEVKETSLLHCLDEWHRNKKEGPEVFESLVFETFCDNLYLIGSFPSPYLSPAELVGTTVVSNLLAWAKENFDRVIVDTPPLGVVNDAGALGLQTDGVMLVCRAGRSHKRAIRNCIGEFQHLGVPLLGMVLNDCPTGKTIFGSYAYSNRYSHYNSYGSQRS